MTDFSDISYTDIEATLRPRRKTRIPKLWSYKKKVPDAYTPKYYTAIEFFIPQPNFNSPYPCILVSIKNAKFKMFFRIRELDELEDIFSIPGNEKLKAENALLKAEKEASGIEKVLRDTLNRKSLSDAVVDAKRLVDKETGEIKDLPLIE